MRDQEWESEWSMERMEKAQKVKRGSHSERPGEGEKLER